MSDETKPPSGTHIGPSSLIPGLLQGWRGDMPMTGSYETEAEVIEALWRGHHCAMAVRGRRYRWTSEDGEVAQRIGVVVKRIERDDVRWMFTDWGLIARRYGPGSGAAIGCLLGIVRVVWSCEFISVRYDEGLCQWVCEAPVPNGWRRWSDTELETLIMAMEGFR